MSKEKQKLVWQIWFYGAGLIAVALVVAAARADLDPGGDDVALGLVAILAGWTVGAAAINRFFKDEQEELVLGDRFTGRELMRLPASGGVVALALLAIIFLAAGTPGLIRFADLIWYLLTR